MARTFDAARGGRPLAPEHDDEGARSNRATARLLACAIAALLVSFLVIDRSSAAFRATSANAANHFEPGKVTLSDDDAGAPMFRVPALVPGQPVENCITVTYAGSVYPADVRLSATGAGRLASSLAMRLEVGSGGHFDDCTGFLPEATLFEGTLASFAAAHAPKSGLDVFHPTADSQARAFRFVFGLPEGFADQGAKGDADFQWEVTSGAR